MCVCVGLLGLSEQGATNWVGWNNRTRFSGSSGGQKSRIEEWAGRYTRGGSPMPSSQLLVAAPSPCSPSLLRRHPRLCPSLSSPGSALVHHELAAASPQALSLSLSSPGSLPSVCLYFLPRHGSREGCSRASPWGFPGGKEPACQCRRLKRWQFDPWVWKIPWRRKWQPAPVFLPGESHGPRSLGGYSPGGHKTVRHNGSPWACTHLHELHLQTLHFQIVTCREGRALDFNSLVARGKQIQPAAVLLKGRFTKCRRTKGLIRPCSIHPCEQAALNGARQREDNKKTIQHVPRDLRRRLPWKLRSSLAPRCAPGHRWGLRSRFPPTWALRGQRSQREEPALPSGAGNTPRGHTIHNPSAKPGGRWFWQDNDERTPLSRPSHTFPPQTSHEAEPALCLSPHSC